MATDSEGKGEKNADEKAIAQKRDELLADARRRVEPAAEEQAASGSRMMGLGLQFAVSILLCLYLGQWLDKKLGTAPWLLLLGVFVGAGLGFYSMYRVMTDENRRADEEQNKK